MVRHDPNHVADRRNAHAFAAMSHSTTTDNGGAGRE